MFRENVKNSNRNPRDGLEAEHESFSGLNYRITTAYKQNFISYKRKRTMSLIDEFNAATQSLDRILEKMDETDPADKERPETYVKSMQVKVPQILKAILRVH